MLLNFGAGAARPHLLPQLFEIQDAIHELLLGMLDPVGGPQVGPIEVRPVLLTTDRGPSDEL